MRVVYRRPACAPASVVTMTTPDAVVIRGNLCYHPPRLEDAPMFADLVTNQRQFDADRKASKIARRIQVHECADQVFAAIAARDQASIDRYLERLAELTGRPRHDPKRLG